MRVFAAEFTDCYHESAPCVLSLHYTKAGAYWAVRRHKLALWKECEGIGWGHKLWFISSYVVEGYSA